MTRSSDRPIAPTHLRITPAPNRTDDTDQSHRYAVLVGVVFERTAQTGI
jgi:hypothetical protein